MTKRSLMLAGGGMKVAFQAGVMQVWLDEAGLAFQHVDGASGGCLNLAMLCQGMSGGQIADNWRKLHPVAGARLNWMQYERLFFARSILSFDGYREKVFPAWGLDFPLIVRSKIDATFNLYNFSKQQLEVFAPSDMSVDALCASVCLPMWFPPVVLGADTYIDAVYVTDCNVEEAINRGADEIWVVWTVSQAGVWADGFVNNYFQIIEAAANGRFKQICSRVEASNSAIAAGGPGEFRRHIELKILRAEVDLNYLINFSTDRVAEAVNRGVEFARAWCKERAIVLHPQDQIATIEDQGEPTNLQFTELMRGYVQRGEDDYDKGFRTAELAGAGAAAELTIWIDDVSRFVTEPSHKSSAVGYVTCAPWGDRRPVTGTFNLLVDSDSPARKRMDYRLHFDSEDGQPLTLIGFKDIKGSDGSDAWTDTTTLFTRILKGHVDDASTENDVQILGAGIIRIHLLDFLHQLTTFKVVGPTRGAEAHALDQFGTLFLGKLWDVYARNVLPASPF